MALHEELENRLAKFKGTEAALVFNSGFQANTGILSTLTGDGDVIFSDALNHASIIDGCRLVARENVRLRPLRSRTTRRPRSKQAAGARRKLIVTETIFSMDGDEAPLNGNRRARGKIRRHGDGRRGACDRHFRSERRRRRRQVGSGRSRCSCKWARSAKRSAASALTSPAVARCASC